MYNTRGERAPAPPQLPVHCPHRAGEVATALALLQRAVEGAAADAGDGSANGGGGGGGGMSSRMHRATLAFNRGRLLEAGGEYKAAAALYKEVRVRACVRVCVAGGGVCVWLRTQVAGGRGGSEWLGRQGRVSRRRLCPGAAGSKARHIPHSRAVASSTDTRAWSGGQHLRVSACVRLCVYVRMCVERPPPHRPHGCPALAGSVRAPHLHRLLPAAGLHRPGQGQPQGGAGVRAGAGVRTAAPELLGCVLCVCAVCVYLFSNSQAYDSSPFSP